MITCVQPASRSIGAETSPVNAPSFSHATSWAETLITLPAADSATACNAVNGGATITSQWSIPAILGLSARMNPTASAMVLYIFQLPAITGCLGSVGINVFTYARKQFVV